MSSSTSYLFSKIHKELFFYQVNSIKTKSWSDKGSTEHVCIPTKSNNNNCECYSNKFLSAIVRDQGEKANKANIKTLLTFTATQPIFSSIPNILATLSLVLISNCDIGLFSCTIIFIPLAFRQGNDQNKKLQTISSPSVAILSFMVGRIQVF